MDRRLRAVAVVAMLVATVPACGSEATSQGPRFGSPAATPTVPEYRFAVHPLYNPAQLMASYQPLVDYLNERLQGARLKLEASRDYPDFEQKYGARAPALLLPNPWQTIQAVKVGYRVIAMAGEPQDFKGIFVVRRDSGVTVPADLKGRAVSYPSPTALAACIMPQFYLHQHGIDITSDIDNRYVGSQESSIMNVFLKLTAAGATWPPPWRVFQKEHPAEAAELMVIWETESLVNNSVMVRDDVPTAVGDQVRGLLSGLDSTPEGRSILLGMETARFSLASDATYDVVRDYVTAFEREVRPIAGP